MAFAFDAADDAAKALVSGADRGALNKALCDPGALPGLIEGMTGATGRLSGRALTEAEQAAAPSALTDSGYVNLSMAGVNGAPDGYGFATADYPAADRIELGPHTARGIVGPDGTPVWQTAKLTAPGGDAEVSGVGPRGIYSHLEMHDQYAGLGKPPASTAPIEPALSNDSRIASLYQRSRSGLSALSQRIRGGAADDSGGVSVRLNDGTKLTPERFASLGPEDQAAVRDELAQRSRERIQSLKDAGLLSDRRVVAMPHFQILSNPDKPV